MRVLITGLPLFSKRLAEDLQEFDPENHYRFFDTYYSKWQLFRFFFQLRKADVVISLNGVSDQSRTMDEVVKRKKKLVLQWMGSDALLAMERYRSGTLLRKYIDYASNYIDSPWLEQELSSIGVETEEVKFKYFVPEKAPVERYESLRVVTYIAQNHQEFYGLSWVLELAKAYPEIPFEVYGTATSETPAPSNVRWMGWQPESVFREAVRRSPVFLRLTEHDGFSVSVIEALTLGAEVFSRMPAVYTTHVTSIEDCLEKFGKKIEEIVSRGMAPDKKLAGGVQREFNRNTILSAYVQKLKTL